MSRTIAKQMEAIDFISDPTMPQVFDKSLRTMQVTVEVVLRAAQLK